MNQHARLRLGGAGLALATVMAMGALTGCSSTDATSDVAPQVPSSNSSSSADIGTNWKFIPIESDNVAEAGYDASTFTLIVKFKKGAVYSYSPVPPAIWQQFQDAQPDPWSKVGKPYLVDGQVPYHQLQ